MTSRRVTKEQKAAHARWAAKRRRLVGYGQWEPFVSSEPVRAHLRALQEAGMPVSGVVRALGMSRDALRYVMWGCGGYGPSETIRKETADAVLGYWPSLEDFPDAARIDPTGTRRRVQALAVLGWTSTAIAADLGRREASFNNALMAPKVAARFARAVAAFYDTHWNLRPEEHGVAGWVAQRARNRAQRLGWAPVGAWDDDTIDDPTARPQIDAIAPEAVCGPQATARFLMGESVILDPDGRRDVITHLMEWTEKTPEQIGELLDMSGGAVSRSWERIKAGSRAEGGRELRRRVFVASVPDRGRNMNHRVEMESAA
jgi:hypothetical protein